MSLKIGLEEGKLSVRRAVDATPPDSDAARRD
jgi:hypothetical protein